MKMFARLRLIKVVFYTLGGIVLFAAVLLSLSNGVSASDAFFGVIGSFIYFAIGYLAKVMFTLAAYMLHKDMQDFENATGEKP